MENNMTYEQFLSIILNIQKADVMNDKLYALGVRLDETLSPLHVAIEILMETYFGKEGAEWISWYCWDNRFGAGGLQATIEDVRVCHTLESLYEVVMNCRKKHDGE